MSRGISSLQKRIIQAIANATVNTYDDDAAWERCGGLRTNTTTRYSHVFNLVSDHWWEGVPAQPGERRHAVARSGFSRAVWSLVRRGLVNGLALAWAEVPGGDVVRWQGDRLRPDKDGWLDNSPRLKLLGLTRAGWDVAKQLSDATEATP